MGVKAWLVDKLVDWLNSEDEQRDIPLCDFDRLSFEIRPCDVLLVEGRNRISNFIKTITLSSWTHSALYIGRLHDIEDAELKDIIRRHYDGDPTDQLLIEPLLGQGTVISPLSKYKDDHLRICRPRGLSRQDVRQVVREAVGYFGREYDIRHLFDLARFIFPYGMVPRRWRSTLFEHNAGTQAKTVCSTMIAEVFAAVHYPVLPVIHRTEDGGLKLYKRNTRLYTPRDFDYSPYFEVIKYPLLGFGDAAVYRQLPWDQEGVVCNAAGECYAADGKRVHHTVIEVSKQAG
jgi:hypothetical protein